MTEATTVRRSARAEVDDPTFSGLRARTAARLLPAVERLLESASYHELSVDQIVAEAGISRSTFYHYFEDRSDLLRAFTIDVMGSILRATAAWWSLPAGASREEVAGGLRELSAAYRPHARLMTAVGDAMPHDPQLGEAFRSFIAEGTDKMEEYVRRGQAAGVMQQGLDPQATAHWLTWMFERGLSRLGRPDAEADPDRVVAALVDLVVNGLRA